MIASVGIATDAEAAPGSNPAAGTWVVGVDGSSDGDRALEWAVLHGADRAARLRLVTVWQIPITSMSTLDGSVALPFDGRALGDAALRDMEELAARTQERVDIPIEAAAVEGGTAATLLDEAQRAELLILGSRGRGGFGSLLLGSTSSQCAAHADSPTVVIRGDGPLAATQRILVGFDGSPNAIAALGWAIAFAAPGSTVVVVWVWDASPLAVGADEYFFPEASNIATTRFHHLVDSVEDDLARDLGADGIEVDRRFLHGRPRDVLLDEATSADLVVAGARGLGAVGAALLGSVTTSLLHHLDRPLVVVPGGGRYASSTTAVGDG